MSTSDRDLWVCLGGFQHREVPLTGIHTGEYFLVSKNDYDRCMQHTWYIVSGYPCTKINGKHVTIQQFITGQDYADHINHDKLDNRRANFFMGGASENNRNIDKKKPTSTSIYPGVNWHKQAQKWLARIRIGEEQRSLGLFKNELEAAYAYYKAARLQHPYMDHPGWSSTAFEEYVLQQQFSLMSV